VSIILTLGYFLIFHNFFKPGPIAIRNACRNNLLQVQEAKKTWALKNKKSPGYVPNFDDVSQIISFLKSGMPRCHAKGEYQLNSVGEEPECSIHGSFATESDASPTAP
jgi:hypothetical protein